MLYIEVILPLPLGNSFTYIVPDELESKTRIGMRVIVPFGKTKMYTAIISLIHTQQPELPYEPKEIIEFLDEKPILRHPQLKFWEWISAYYMAYLGNVYQAAVPSGLKLESETLVRINMNYESDVTLSDKELLMLDALSDGKVQSVSELEKLTNQNRLLPNLRVLLEKGAVEISETIKEKFHSKTEKYVRLTEFAKDENNLHQIFDELNRTPKRLEVLMKYIELSKWLKPAERKEISKKELLEKSGASIAVFNGLIEKKVLETYDKVIGRLDNKDIETDVFYPLNEVQQQAKNEIVEQFETKSTVLLHGVTSSGKTEIYIHLISEMLEQKKQVLYLVPEIALTTQLVTRLRRVFGNKLGIYHSKFSDAERVEIWNNVLNDKGYEIILGVRSSVFLPFRQLGLIIVDEEHENSYKQYEPSPRYHARNAAVVLASMHNAKTLLGTATPSIESYYNAKIGKYGYVQITQRFKEIELPEILVVDTKELKRKKEMEGHFSPKLIEKSANALKNKEQILLFQNRRGYAPFLECSACSYVPKCKNCDVSLTVHKYLNKLTCHYCGYTENIPAVCPSCNTPNLEYKGFGTEKIEDEIKAVFPEASVSRMDTDTTRNKKSHDKIITDFEQGKVDILVGTQMISKGLDFEHVSLVGILNADNMLNFPDFRAEERAFQLMAQVSGRAGRKHKRGTVVLQTSNPKHRIINEVIGNNYEGMFQSQLAERKQFGYPPFVRLIEITLRHKDAKNVDLASKYLANQLISIFGKRVIGPNIPMVSRIQNQYIKQITLKLELEISMEKSKNLLQSKLDEMLAQKEFRSIRVGIDVDPM